ncbi:NUDIX hydrolase [Terrarubrum flagellatum]|uniref:NUDIX hydrolase n=1 Tax=Terrirubrum flagellatum TaxID=2895980 RepID=UPI00314564D3
MSDAHPVRYTSRLLVFDPADRLLLLEYESTIAFDPNNPARRGFWYTPGGGIDPGETPEQAALRELDEEVGIRGVTLGPCVATCRALRDRFMRISLCHERYFIIRAPSDRIDTSRLAETDIDPVLDVRWWNIDEFIASREPVIPEFVPGLARRILSGDSPAAPIDFS